MVIILTAIKQSNNNDKANNSNPDFGIDTNTRSFLSTHFYWRASTTNGNSLYTSEAWAAGRRRDMTVSAVTTLDSASPLLPCLLSSVRAYYISV